MMQQRALPITREEQQRAVGEIIDEVVGYGPIERLLHDPEVSDILINGHDDVWVEMRGKLHRTNIRFRDDGHLMHVIHRIVAAVGRRIDESNPYVDARLADGSRFNAIIPPLAIDGPTVSIRRFGAKPLQAADLVRFGTLPRPVLALLEACIQGKLNVLVSGGTGSGKTTLLNVLSGYIPDDERVVTIEDAAELKLQQPHVVRLETRPPNIEGEGEVTTRDLVRNALRMRPDRIVVGEIRGAEAIDMLQAMNTGHEGSISTVHANSPRHALRRIETMVGLGMGNIPGTSIREMISDALDLIIQIARMPDGSRRLTS
ncbi:MAG: CpaF family protein, partial [Alphaproteobacteria bacterium]|nr:CpaF family protein [Alphaproteobacteria bacterium]